MRRFCLVGRTAEGLYLVISSDEADEKGVLKIDRDRERREGVLGVWEIVETDDGTELVKQ